jgi:prevent-host-death family protein
MITINVDAAEGHLARLLEQVEAGEELVLARAGKPVARMVPMHQPDEPRRPGALAGRIHIAEDFDAPLPESILRGFRGETP